MRISTAHEPRIILLTEVKRNRQRTPHPNSLRSSHSEDSTCASMDPSGLKTMLKVGCLTN